MPSVSGSMSAKRIVAPARANANAVVTKVNEGTITTSPGPMSSSSADSSSASVHDVVSKTSAGAELLREQCRHPRREATTARGVVAVDRLGDVVELATDASGSVERDQAISKRHAASTR